MSIMNSSLLGAAAAALATIAGNAHAGGIELAASSTILHDATFNISYTKAFGGGTGMLAGSYGGAPTNFLSSSDYGANPAAATTGSGPLSGTLRYSLWQYDADPQDRVEGRFFFDAGGAASYYEATYTFDLEFNDVSGGVEFVYGNTNWNWTIAPVGGSAVALNFGDVDDGISGDVVNNGRYTITATYTHNLPFPAASAITSFSVASMASGGGAVPGPGAALIASMGLAGISRRRRR